ncbi:hypothetical protein ACLB2K_031451 [Fragaria x ananassa]
MAASVAAMTANLASKLSLSKQEEPVDLRNLCSPAKGFMAPRFYLVGCVNIARAVEFELFRSVVRNMWRLANPVEVFARDDRFLFSFISEREKNCVKRGGPWGYQRAMIFLNDYNGFSNIMAVPLTFVWIWVEIKGFPPALTTAATTRLVGETIGTVL